MRIVGKAILWGAVALVVAPLVVLVIAVVAIARIDPAKIGRD